MDSTEALLGEVQKEAQTKLGDLAVVPKSHIHYSISVDARQQICRASWDIVWGTNVAFERQSLAK